MQLAPIHPDAREPPSHGRGGRRLRPPGLLPVLRDGDLLYAVQAMRLQPAAADTDEHHAVCGPALLADTLLPLLPVPAQGEGAGAAVHPVSQLAAVRRAGAGPQATGTVILFGTTNSRAQLSFSVESSFAELSPWCFRG